MPPLKVCKHAFLIAADDLVFIAPVDALMAAAWMTAVTWRIVRLGAWKFHVPLWLLDADGALSFAALLFDGVLFVCASRGPIMNANERNRICGPLLVFRVLCLGILQVTVATGFAGLVVYHVVLCAMGKERELSSLPGPLEEGWGAAEPPSFPELAHATSWLTVVLNMLKLVFSYVWTCEFALLAYVSMRCLTNAFGFAAVVVTAIPQQGFHKLAGSRVMQKAKQVALRCSGFGAGTKNDILNAVTMAVMEGFGDMSLEKIVPSDVAFGLLLVMTEQGQGFIAPTDDEARVRIQQGSDMEAALLVDPEGQRCSVATVRACTLGSSSRTVKCLANQNAVDRKAMESILHFDPFARGMYGYSVSLLTEATRPGTSIITPGRLFQALYNYRPALGLMRLFRWRREEEGGSCCFLRGATVGDTFGANEYALRRAVGETSNAELKFGNWKTGGVGCASPFAVLVDHERRELIITIRGTLNIQDAMVDLGAAPEFFDPFGVSRPGERRDPPFNDDSGLFVHAGMKHVAEDTWKQLQARRLLHDVSDVGELQDYDVVCVGHSLGAGVACILAMIVWQQMPNLRSRIRYVGFEPPGGLLSASLAHKTAEMGWISVTCGYDMIPRLSVKAMQCLREDVLYELSRCHRSKFQLTALLIGGLIKYSRFLFCVKRPLSRLFECVGGGPLTSSTHVRENETIHVAARINDISWFNQLHPAGRIVYCKPLSEEWQACGLYPRASSWQAEWVEASMLQRVILSYRSMEMHLPPVIKDAYKLAAERIGVNKSSPS
eukprot:TRINITY_DN23295_c0_g1_i1.p1 TRINITY_DN23295_c0_g1~~TRINITY_DN23295_c0_g1_i1.p1  ORF type:complete len:779 (+),score=61.15 TRINITY_DN23295_c0_g1_i1:70-2406(+)